MKERIIKESIRLFLKKGFKGTSIQDITDALDITKGAFYWYFKSKRDLLFEIVGVYETDFIDPLISYMRSQEGSFLKLFRAYHRYINEFAAKNWEICVLFVTLSAELAGSGTEEERRIKAVYEKYLSFIEQILLKGRLEGRLKEGIETRLLSHVILAFHTGILLQWYLYRNEIDGPSLARTYRDAMLFGFVKP
jgi:AcrR family transcriptional regulator